MKNGNFDINTILIYVAIGVITGLVITLVRVLVKSGILRRVAAWFTTTPTGNTVRRLLAVLLFILIALFIGYFVYTGFRI
ncbi:unknown [Acidiphilium sp. CAG:727]|jgi:hypothetical protein|nr:unknown [Acidiphilium sp. CAG:727]